MNINSGNPPKPLGKEDLKSKKQTIAFKPKNGKETMKLIPLTKITGHIYGKKLPAWWDNLYLTYMYLLDQLKGEEVVLYRSSDQSDWVYAIYRGMRRFPNNSQCEGLVDRIYYFQTSANELSQIKYTYIPKDLPKECGEAGAHWSGGEIALCFVNKFPSKKK